MDFLGNDGFDKILERMFGGLPMKRIFEDGTRGTRVYFPKKGDTSVSKNKNSSPEPAWRKEVRSSSVEKPVEFPKEETPVKRNPPSILEMLVDGDKRLEELLGKIIDKKLDERRMVTAPSIDNGDVERGEIEFDEYESEDEEDDLEVDEMPKKDPSVFIANRLTFLIQTLFPIVFDTSMIDTGTNSLTIALNEGKTYPKLMTLDDLGFITSRINASPTVVQEIEDYLKDTGYANIYCFPSTIIDKRNNLPKILKAVKFVIYPNGKQVDF